MTAFNLNKGGTNYTAPITLPPGTVGNPPLQWTDAGIGIYQVGSAAIGFSIAGTNVGTLDAGGLTLPGTLAVTGAVAFGAQSVTTLTANAIVGGDASLGITGLAGDGVAGGAIPIAGGAAINANGGAVSLVGGSATGLLSPGNGGNADLSAGTGNGSGVNGLVTLQGDANIIPATYFFTGSPAATDQAFFLAPRALVVKSIRQIHSVAAGGTSTLTVIKDTSTAAPGAGTVIQTGSFNLNATANTVQTGTLAASAATLTLAAGDRLSVKFANAIQSSAGVVVVVGMMPA